jgi:hypothetical protein
VLQNQSAANSFFAWKRSTITIPGLETALFSGGGHHLKPALFLSKEWGEPKTPPINDDIHSWFHIVI